MFFSFSHSVTHYLVVIKDLDCKTVSSFAGRSKIQARSSNGKLGRGNGRADGSEKEWGEGLKKETVAFAYFKSVLEFFVPQETLNSHWSVFRQELLSITHHNPSKAVDLRYGFGKLNMDLHALSREKLSGIVLKSEQKEAIYALLREE